MKNLITTLVILISCAAKAAVGDSVLVYRGNAVVQTNLSYVVSNLTVNGSFLNTNQFSGNNAIKSGALLTNIVVAGSQLSNTTFFGTSNGSNVHTVTMLPAASSPYSAKLIYGTDDTGWKFAISKNRSGTITDQFVINDSTGYVGIGTTNPLSTLDINGSLGFSSDTFLVREAANTLALRNGTNATTFSVYDVYNNASDFSRLKMYSDGTAYLLVTQKAGSAAARHFYIQTSYANENLYFGAAGTTSWLINNSGSHLEPVSNNAYNIGKSDSIVKSLYVSNIVAKGEVQAASLRVTNAVQLAITSGGSVTLGNHHTYLANTNLTTVTLPTAVGNSGKIYTIKAINPATSVTITNSTGSQTIDGALSYSLTASNKFVTVQSDNANWWIIGGN